MKRPRHMTMRELIALPVLKDCQKLQEPSSGYDGAFKDECGQVWGTLKLASGWVRFPAHLALLA